MQDDNRDNMKFLVITILIGVVTFIVGFLVSEVIEGMRGGRELNGSERMVPMKTQQSVIRRKATEAFMDVEAGYAFSYETLVAVRTLISNPVALNLIDEEIERYQQVQNRVKGLLNGTPFDEAA